MSPSRRRDGPQSPELAQVPDVASIQAALQARKRGLLGQDLYVKTAVLVPIVRDVDGQPAVLFEKRAATLRRQAGEICFPGGHVSEEDADEAATAIRETCEELCIDKRHVSLLGPLDVLVGFGQLMVYPYAGVIDEAAQIDPNPDEVAEVFTVSLQRLLTTPPEVYEMTFQHLPGEDFPFHLIPNGRNYKWRQGVVPQLFYQFDGYVIWGLTARILTHFLDIVRAAPEFLA
ncbi:CoA pyrophosphatase [Alicyclobacillus cycloheptanicus]|uniref:8-oxo-dGTP pyrophosphatase MutT (NUDIX family) n=1 Tax=Alicyclobacillus cycloheptanicus TaxID=1457 RepID=A0ABT9XM67_9BACL|nr:CoA pyrophosphatase [Alicyclobacillus cycloheptanicus]MDQ0191411.1 8-oxo-dGTP pyrophosphatase MutT (NUDIX family) [Alicyclobacillus cycloheptanicus]WDM00325.1 CoA pyrophosphatase [Alicyclobacillus cycloheptanicus]